MPATPAIRALALAALLPAAAAPAVELYVAAQERVGSAAVLHRPVPACPEADDVARVDAAIWAQDAPALDAMAARGCVLLQPGSHGEIIGAWRAPMLLHLRMDYMPGHPVELPEPGPDLYVEPLDVLPLGQVSGNLVDTWRALTDG